MSTAGLIYVAGNPDLYPLEYYDAESGTYQGVIPAFLEQFAQEAGYELQYFQPGEDDRRGELAQNRQVDIVSGCVDGEIQGEQIPLFRAEADGEETEYCLVLTNVAPEPLAEACAAICPAWNRLPGPGSVVHTMQQSTPQNSLLPLTAGLGLAVCALLAALALMYRRSRAKLRLAEANRLRDPDTGLYVQEYLLRRFPALVNDNNRALYYISYFHLNLSHVEWRVRPGSSKCPAAPCSGSTELAARCGRDRVPGIRGRPCRLDDRREPARRGGALPGRDRADPFFAKDAGCASDMAAGVYPLQAGDHDLSRSLFIAEQCAHKACREGKDC